MFEGEHYDWSAQTALGVFDAAAIEMIKLIQDPWMRYKDNSQLNEIENQQTYGYTLEYTLERIKQAQSNKRSAFQEMKKSVL